MNIRDVILAPVITEKSVREASLGRYTFKVIIDASKPFIRQAVERKFNVKVLKIMVSIVKGKTERRGIKREEFVKTAWKKATVQLAKGQKIAIFDIGGQEKKK